MGRVWGLLGVKNRQVSYQNAWLEVGLGRVRVSFCLYGCYQSLGFLFRMLGSMSGSVGFVFVFVHLDAEGRWLVLSECLVRLRVRSDSLQTKKQNIYDEHNTTLDKQ